MKSYKATYSDPPNAQRASLLSIPRELRFQIYTYLFRAKTKIPFVDGIRTCEWSPFPGWGLISTCKQLHTELGDYIYERNTLLFQIIDRSLFRGEKIKTTQKNSTGNPPMLSPPSLECSTDSSEFRARHQRDDDGAVLPNTPRYPRGVSAVRTADM
jgi:hypothetical protein